MMLLLYRILDFLEIDSVREKFDNVVVIKVERINFETSLDSKEQAHVTEIAMDNYDDVDYIVTNDTLDKLEKIYTIYIRRRNNMKKLTGREIIRMYLDFFVRGDIQKLILLL